MGSGTILREVEAAAELLAADWNVTADVWSATSFTELQREARAAERWNRLHPGKEPRTPYVQQCLAGREGPLVISTDYIRTFGGSVAPYVHDRPVTVLGTDGFGRSDYRRKLRRFFEVDREHVVVAALRALGDTDAAAKAIAQYDNDPDVEPPWLR
jgi:pyruvate dehydrogenase E1 component